MNNIPRFADLLTTALQRIKLLEGKKLAIIQDELGYALGRESGGSVIEYWRKGKTPASLGEVEKLCHHLRQRTDFDQEWFRLLLSTVNHPNIAAVCRDLFDTAPCDAPAASVRPAVGDFVGRQEEQAQIISQLSQTSLAGHVLAVRGMGGVGKTELVYAVAHQLSPVFPGGVITFALGGTTAAPSTPTQALQAAIRLFSADERLPDDLPGLQSLYHATLKSRRVLLIADDAYDAAQVRMLIPPAGSALVITTRRRFTLPGLLIVDLATLGAEESQRLALTICPRLGAHAATLSRLCGYLPLALRVSASLLVNDDSYPITEYLDQLANEYTRLQLLRDPDDSVLDVEASLNLSFACLAPFEQAGLSQLSVFPASFDFAAADAVVQPPADQSVRTILSHLRRQNLLEYDQHRDRYRLHDLVRMFAWQKLADQSGVTLRYVQHYVQRTAALDQSYKHGGADVLGALQQFDCENTHLNMAWRWLQQQPATPDTDALLLQLVYGTIFIGDIRYSIRDERLPQLEAGLAAARRLGDRRLERICLGNLGRAYFELNQLSSAIIYYQQALTQARADGSRAAEANALDNLAQSLIIQSELGQARSYLEQAVVISREIGDRLGEASSLNNLGVVQLRQGRLGPATTYLEQAQRVLQETGYQRGLAWNNGYLGLVYADCGDLQRALTLIKQGITITQNLADRSGEIRLAAYLGWVYLKQQALALAEQQLKATLSSAQRLGEHQMESWILRKLSILAYRLGHSEQSRQYFQQSMAIQPDRADLWEVAQDSWLLGTMLAQAGNLEAAIPLLQRWIAYQSSVDHVHKERDQAEVQRLCAQPAPRPLSQYGGQ